MRGAAMVESLVIAAFVCLPSGCGPAAPIPSGDAPARAQVEARLGRLVDELHAAGRFDGAVVVSDAGGVFFERGFGWADAERKVPFTPDTPTDGASLAKTFTAALVLALQAEGRIDLDAPVMRWLPELPYPEVTLRHLLSHSSGIPVHDYDFFDADLPPGTVRTTEALLGVLAKRRPPLATRPGVAFEYSSFGYDLAALAAERAGGKPWFDLLNDRFFRPLGIRSAFARPGRFADFPGVRSLGYRRDGGRLLRNEVFEDEAFHGGSNLYISARDLDRWGASFLHAPRLGPAAMGADLAPASVGGAASGLTLGSWYRSPDDGAFWYSGHLRGFHSEVFRDRRRGWSVVSTSNNTMDPWLQKGLVRAIVAALEGREPGDEVAIPPIETLTAEARALVAGRYLLPHGEALEVAPASDDGTHATFVVTRGGVRYRAFPEGPASSYVPGLDLMLGFARHPPRMFVSSALESGWIARAGDGS
ncbi:MAG TPA: serine hydrolase domain-containing protein [Candidatus Polarisedimenticolia bacterium]|jgi:CubicO group peptidase (beta-lactamase class C family)|nr:serine hydrolase domain-containing protein [Candidatus Polarisedimenticolia bacterium]